MKYQLNVRKRTHGIVELQDNSGNAVALFSYRSRQERRNRIEKWYVLYALKNVNHFIVIKPKEYINETT